MSTVRAAVTSLGTGGQDSAWMQELPELHRAPLALHRAADLTRPASAVARGDLVRVRDGVYADAASWRALPPWDRYLARVHAVALLRPDAVFCLESACALSGIPVFGDPGIVHVLGGPRSTGRLVNGVRTHAASLDRQIVEHRGMAMTSLAETAVDVARHRHTAVGLSVADATLRSADPLSREMLRELNERRTSSRGRAVARATLGRADARAESALESVSRAVIEWLGFPAPELQRVFRSPGRNDRGDFWWERWSVLGEADGDLKYDGTLGDPRGALTARRERDIRLGSRVRTISHWGWTETTSFDPLRRILLGAGLPIVAAEDTAALLSMRRLLRPR